MGEEREVKRDRGKVYWMSGDGKPWGPMLRST